MLKKFFNDESGQGMVEYILIVALIAIAAIAAVKLFGKNIREFFGTASEKVSDAHNEIK